jgi:hypothetical protein
VLRQPPSVDPAYPKRKRPASRPASDADTKRGDVQFVPGRGFAVFIALPVVDEG